jgi:uncharacterized SAM-binding protein YcdF (DUF218 family)
VINHLSALIVPSGLATALFVLAAAAAVTRTTRRFSAPLATMAALVLLLFSNGLVATLLISPLEYEFPAVSDPSRFPEVRTIVVLTGYAADDAAFPLSAKMNAASAFRVLEAANILSQRPDCRIIVSGHPVAARVMGQQLRQLGVPDAALMIDNMSNSTAASAATVHELLGSVPVFLVTSAGHLRRAVWAFRRSGLEPVAAPTDYQLPRSVWQSSWTTSAAHLQASDLAIHEYVALAWYRARGVR